MAKQQTDGISWATYSFNLNWGCVEIGNDPACGPTLEFPNGARCYARIWSERCGYNDKTPATGKPKTLFPIWGAHAPRRFFGDKHWTELLTWNKNHTVDDRGRVFIQSMGDWAEGRSDQSESLERLWPLIELCENLDMLMLTKRPQLIAKLCPLTNHPRVWQGTTVANQHWMDIRAPFLRDVEALVKWFSLEPMVGPVRLPQWFLDMGARAWIVIGGQSAMGQPKATPIPFEQKWALDLLEQCREAKVRFHFKQLSGRTKEELKAIPPALMIREYPEVIA